MLDRKYCMQSQQPVEFVKRKGIDYVKFSLIPMTSLEEKRLINKNSLKILNDPKGQWMVTYRRYTNNRWDQLFRFIIETDVKELWLSYNMVPNILKDISNVKFPSLIKLYLWENQITSLQALEVLDAPNLQELNLEKNEIYSLKPLRKLLSSSLLELNISRNPVRKLEALEQTAIGEELRGVFIENPEDDIIVNDLTCFLRWKNARFTKLMVVGSKRMRQFKVEAMFEKRFPGTKLKVRELGPNYYSNEEIKKRIDTPRLNPQTIYLRQNEKLVKF